MIPFKHKQSMKLNLDVCGWILSKIMVPIGRFSHTCGVLFNMNGKLIEHISFDAVYSSATILGDNFTSKNLKPTKSIEYLLYGFQFAWFYQALKFVLSFTCRISGLYWEIFIVTIILRESFVVKC